MGAVSEHTASLQHAPVMVSGVYCTTSFGRLLTVAFSRVAKRLAVSIWDSSPRTSQPWFWLGESSHVCTSATIPEVEPHT